MSHANRGKPLETYISMTNTQYRNKGIALIDKVPNAWVVQRAGKRIVSAFPERKTGVDFVGVSNGRAIAIEAKSTTERSRFPLSMIEQHQIEFLQQFQEQGGIAFFIIEFSKLQEIYFVPLDYVLGYVTRAAEGGRKSIPYEDMQLDCERVQSERGYVLHYLKHAVKQQ